MALLLVRRCGLPQLARRAPTIARRAASSSAPITVRPLHLLLYHYVEDVEEARQPFRAGHIAAARAAANRGDLLMGGALADPIDGGVLVFSGSAAAEDFAESDPYVINEVVTHWTVREWSVVVGALELPPVPPFRPTHDWVSTQRLESPDFCAPR